VVEKIEPSIYEILSAGLIVSTLCVGRHMINSLCRVVIGQFIVVVGSVCISLCCVEMLVVSAANNGAKYATFSHVSVNLRSLYV